MSSYDPSGFESWAERNDVSGDPSAEGSEGKKKAPLDAARPLIDFASNPPDPQKTLLGNRFLCREGGMLFVGPSGVGKTSASVQQDLLWSVGLPAFGIAPARPLKILTIQAEDGDLSEIVSSVKSGLHFTMDQIQESRERCFYITERSRTGDLFLQFVVKPLLELHRPDLLRINPLQAYLDGDIKNPEVTAHFFQCNLKMPRDFAGTLYYNLCHTDWRDVIPRINLPTLIISGRASGIPWKSQEWIHRQIKGSQFEVFEESEGGQHFMFIENPEKFNRLVMEYLG